MFNLFNKYKTENKNKKPIFKTISPKKYSLYISNFMNNSKNQVFVEGFIQGDYIKKMIIFIFLVKIIKFLNLQYYL